MNLLFFCPRWGSESLSWEAFFLQVKNAGFDGVEIGFPFTLSANEKAAIIDGLKAHDLKAIGQHWQTIESNFTEHITTFKRHLYSLVELQPMFINSQTGKDYFSIEQNMELMNIANEISKETGIPILHETHRGKWSFAAHITQQYLQLYPQIKITLDISHWCNVAESLLEDQVETVQLAIEHTHHLHARIGYQEGPQVIDPRAPENSILLQTHLQWWDHLIETQIQKGSEHFTITPEYGAPPYQHLLPYTNMPITSQWDINCWMKELLKNRYATS